MIGGGVAGFATPLSASAPYDGSDKDKAPDDGWRIRVFGSGISGFAAEAICLRK